MKSFRRRDTTFPLWLVLILLSVTGCGGLVSRGEGDGVSDADSTAQSPTYEYREKVVLDARRYKLVLPKEAPKMGYIKFFRSGLEGYSSGFEIHQVLYDSSKLLGKITNDQELCIQIREGFTMFKVIAEDGNVDRETVKVLAGKIKPLEVVVAWDKGYRVAFNNPYRWDIFGKHRNIPFDEKECKPVMVQ